MNGHNWDEIINKKGGYATLPTLEVSFEFLEELAKRIAPMLAERRAASVAEMEVLKE